MTEPSARGAILPTASAMYEGVIRHRRRGPHAHAFRYRIAQLYIDLDELDGIFEGRWLWSVNRRNLAEFRRSDYLGPRAKSLAEAVRDCAERRTGRRPQGPIRLLTHLRYAGYVFNPVSFYYCYAADGATLECVIAEITNTPWRERHAYVLPVSEAQKSGGLWHWSFAKTFHVSPFIPMERRYAWSFGEPGPNLRVHMGVLRGERQEFDANLVLERRALDASALRRVLWRYPLMTVQVIAAIHWQALRLWGSAIPSIHIPPMPRGCHEQSGVCMMNEAEETAGARRMPATEFSALDRLLRRQLIERLKGLRYGHIVIQDACGSVVLGDEIDPELRVFVRIHDPAVYRALAMNGSVGAGETYIQGHWRCDDLVGLARLFVRNRDLLDGMEKGFARFGAWALRAWHALRPNTRNGSRANIAAHYDLGNEFFGLFLSPDLMYSSALWSGHDDTLERASTRKLDAICRRLDLRATDRLVEIGTGWGGFALHAARHYGCHVTTTTISQEQYALACRRVAQAGLGERITVLCEDYRDLRGEYDKLVSIEMIEAIGARYLDTYFAKLAGLLKPGGLALLQAITIEDHRYEQALGAVDFIKRYVFPGSFIPSVTAMLNAKSRVSDLNLVDMQDFGPSYARTIEVWRARFLDQRRSVRRLGFDDCFIRLWEFYLAYCEAGFREEAIGVAHLLFAKPGPARL